MLAIHCQDPVLNQQCYALASTCHLTHPGPRGGAVACQGHISEMQWASEVEEGGGVAAAELLIRGRCCGSVKSSFSG